MNESVGGLGVNDRRYFEAPLPCAAGIHEYNNNLIHSLLFYNPTADSTNTSPFQAKSFRESKDALRSRFTEMAFRVNTLSAVEWRVDQVIGSSSSVEGASEGADVHLKFAVRNETGRGREISNLPLHAPTHPPISPDCHRVARWTRPRTGRTTVLLRR